MFSRLNLTGFGARLAILAVALQLVLSLAHNHGLTLPPSQPTFEATQGGSPGDAPLLTGDCAICANIAAFHGLAMPNAILIPAPAKWILIFIALPPLLFAARSHYRLFRTRAPPSV